mmetsp:Transcript_31216/g.101795  ORF Transcript_31216/g.101795 Transcript_31216/m.101795 type:complete len:306 (-) Transcript_31216:2201-3118(-)
MIGSARAAREWFAALRTTAGADGAQKLLLLLPHKLLERLLALAVLAARGGDRRVPVSPALARPFFARGDELRAVVLLRRVGDASADDALPSLVVLAQERRPLVLVSRSCFDEGDGEHAPLRGRLEVPRALVRADRSSRLAREDRLLELRERRHAHAHALARELDSAVARGGCVPRHEHFDRDVLRGLVPREREELHRLHRSRLEARRIERALFLRRRVGESVRRLRGEKLPERGFRLAHAPLRFERKSGTLGAEPRRGFGGGDRGVVVAGLPRHLGRLLDVVRDGPLFGLRRDPALFKLLWDDHL